MRPTRWLFTPAPAGRLAVFRTLLYLFVPLDVLYLTPWVLRHKDVPGELYQPLRIGRLLELPVPTERLVSGVAVALVVSALAGLTGRAPRLWGWLVAVLYLEWMVVAMSYGKVDHDRVGFMVALFALATVGPARWGDPTPNERAGWALRVAQLGVIATYFLAAFAKLRYGGLAWLTGATLTRAVIRRGTVFSDWMLDVPVTLVAMQFVVVAFELASPVVLLLPERQQRRAVGLLYLFHAGTYAAITIAFWPHLVAMTAFLPLERVSDGLRPLRERLAHRVPSRRRRAPERQATAPVGAAADGA
jgi:vitamin K-dependent gamma-carboxylase-like protein